jgi:hypothetical protein
MAWRQCPKRLWLEINRPELVVYPPSTQRRFALGHELGAVARALRPGGELIEPATLGQALRDTARLLGRRGDLTLFEATFSHGGVLVRADVLLREGGVARMIEVKSATEVKPYHIDDSAVQTWVVRGAGVPLERVALACIDRGFIYAGDGDYHGLLRETDITARVDELVAQLPDWIAGCQATLADEMPGHGIWAGCTNPFACPFIPFCSEDPPEHPVALRPRGEVAAGRPPAAAPFPRSYLDFATIRHAVPVWAGTRPWERLPFAWSCHIERAPGELEHREFLDTSGEPPMRSCADTLIATLDAEGPIFVYGGRAHDVLVGLSARFSDLQRPLATLTGRLVDLLSVAAAAWHPPAMKDSWSIQDVLPTVAPELDYADLGEVHDSTAAQIAYAEAVHPDTPSERADELAHGLLAYCALDTLALVRLRRFLSGE